MKRCCYLAGQNDSLLKDVVASLLKNSKRNLDFQENRSCNFEVMLNEILEVQPDVVLINESSPFSMDEFLMRLLIAQPGLPVIVISENSNVMHVVHRETRLLKSSKDLLATLELVPARF